MKGAGTVGQRYATAMDRRTDVDMIGMRRETRYSRASERIVYIRCGMMTIVAATMRNTVLYTVYVMTM